MRTDCHSPSKIVPSEYFFLGIHYDPRESVVVGGAALLALERERIDAFLASKGAHYASHTHGGTCQCCGARADYLAVFFHARTNSAIRVGQDCAAKLALDCDDAFVSARRQVKAARDLATGEARARLQLEERGLLAAWEIFKSMSRDDSDEAIVADLVRRLVRSSTLSDRQWEFLSRLIHRVANREALAKQRAAEKAAAHDCPTGRVAISGVVLAKKLQSTSFGEVEKMLVKTPFGYTVWGSVPKGLVAERGSEVHFIATVTPAKDDLKHGFFSRPVAKK